ncbi:MAG: hypothetical protein JWO55_86 [Candidatus Saccharibacteria bacterium]|nr:hypothetical protein [Candidatus Saccharibacteria bacterium]
MLGAVDGQNQRLVIDHGDIDCPTDFEQPQGVIMVGLEERLDVFALVGRHPLSFVIFMDDNRHAIMDRCHLFVGRCGQD